MTQALALIGYFVLLMTSFLATRFIVIRRGWAGAVLIAFCCSVIAIFFAIAPRYFPWVPATYLLSLALAQMVLIGAVLGIPAGLLTRHRNRTKPPRKR